MNDNDYSKDNLIPLTEHCLLLKNDRKESIIETAIIKRKLNSLLDNIDNEGVQELIEHLIIDEILKVVVTENIISRDAQYINKLSGILLILAVNSFTEVTASSYEENLEFLSVIASKGTSEQKIILVGILIRNITGKKHINKTFDILEVIELKNENSLKMIYGALQTLKDSDNSIDSRIDDLIEKFKINH